VRHVHVALWCSGRRSWLGCRRRGGLCYQLRRLSSQRHLHGDPHLLLLAHLLQRPGRRLARGNRSRCWGPHAELHSLLQEREAEEETPITETRPSSLPVSYRQFWIHRGIGHLCVRLLVAPACSGSGRSSTGVLLALALLLL